MRRALLTSARVVTAARARPFSSSSIRRIMAGDKSRDKDHGVAEWERQLDEKREQDKKHREQKPVDQETDWRKKPPYALENPHDHPKALYRGSCHCEKVKFEVFSDPLDAHFCHCTTCQRTHSAPVHWSAILEKSDVHFINGAKNLTFYKTDTKSHTGDEHGLPCKLSCDNCHAPIADEGRKMLLLYPSLIDFESHEHREPWTPRRHVFYSRRALDVKDGMEKYSEMQFESDLMPEESDTVGIVGKNSRIDRDPNEPDSKERSDNKNQQSTKKKRKNED